MVVPSGEGRLRARKRRTHAPISHNGARAPARAFARTRSHPRPATRGRWRRWAMRPRTLPRCPGPDLSPQHAELRGVPRPAAAAQNASPNSTFQNPPACGASAWAAWSSPRVSGRMRHRLPWPGTRTNSARERAGRLHVQKWPAPCVSRTPNAEVMESVRGSGPGARAQMSSGPWAFGPHRSPKPEQGPLAVLGRNTKSADVPKHTRAWRRQRRALPTSDSGLRILHVSTSCTPSPFQLHPTLDSHRLRLSSRTPSPPRRSARRRLHPRRPRRRRPRLATARSPATSPRAPGL